MWQLFIEPVARVVDTVLKRVLPPEKMSEAERLRLEKELAQELARLDWQTVMGQLRINEAEASSGSLFVAGWRPAVGWVCASAFAYSFVVQPFLAFVAGLYRWEMPPLPQLDMGALMTVLLGMLGLAGYRTYEKVRGVSREHLP